MSIQKLKAATPILLFDSTDRSADLLYFGRFQAPDAFIAYRSPSGERIAVLSALEYGRGMREGKFDCLLSYEELRETAGARLGVTAGYAEVIAEIAHQENIEAFFVPESFPLGMARTLKRLGVELKVAEGALFPERLLKRPDEIEEIRKGCAASSAGFARVVEILTESTILKDEILWNGEVLTSEKVRFEIEVACLKHGTKAEGTIVAGGDQACDPHCRGTGPLRPHELIIVDIFPRIEQSGYFGDMTRTFLKGTPNHHQRDLVETVRHAQKQALDTIAAGVTGDHIHREIVTYFESKGYFTKRESGEYTGFFHSTGHGLGLEIHEGPRIAPNTEALKKEMVVTVEPGLYYPGLGGVRIEDVVKVTENGVELLSEAPYDWIIE